MKKYVQLEIRVMEILAKDVITASQNDNDNLGSDIVWSESWQG